MKLFHRITRTIPGIVVMLSTYLPVKAQYQTALGLRLGGTSGLTFKHQFIGPIYGEAILGTFDKGFSLTVLLEKNLAVPSIKGLFAYCGGGGHLAFYNGRNYYSTTFGREVDYHVDNDVAIGINFIGGLEYKLPDDIPIAISIDVKPFIEIGSGGYVGFAFDPSIGLKFTFP